MSEENDIILECDFAFKCPKKWEYLEPTDDDSIRYCFSCGQEVFFVKTREELEISRQLRRCIAAYVEDVGDVGDVSLKAKRITIAGNPIFYPPDVKPENRLTLAIFGDDEETTNQVGLAIDKIQMKRWRERAKKEFEKNNDKEND